MIKWRNLGLILLVVMFIIGCASKSPKEAKVTSTIKVPPPIFGTDDADESPKDVESDTKTITSISIPDLRIIYFDYDMSEITFEARTILEKHAEYISNNPSVPVRLEGHADERGSREYNLALGEARTEEAKNLLINLGVTEHRLETISYGEEQPIILGHDEKSWWQNRRVEFIYP